MSLTIFMRVMMVQQIIYLNVYSGFEGLTGGIKNLPPRVQII